VAAALERARASADSTDRPSIYGALAMEGLAASPQLLRKRTLIALSHAIEDEAMARAAGPVVVGAFQSERNYRAVEHRYRRLAEVSDCTVVFADFDGISDPPGCPVEIPISTRDPMGNEWAVIIDAPAYAACLLAWEQPRSAAEAERGTDADRRFEAVWTMEPQVVRRATSVAATLAGRVDPALGERIEGLLGERPLGMDTPAPGLTALSNRMIRYLEG
jgi:DICT domain-containing protein